VSVDPTIKDDLFQEQVIKAAQQLFRQYGLQKVTMDDVARAVGKGRSSLYYYYKNKIEIFGAVMDVEIGEILAEMARAVDKAVGVEEKIRAFCVTKLKEARKRREFYATLETAMDADERSHYAKAEHTIRAKMMAQEGDLVRKILTGGVANGELRPVDPKELEGLVFVLLSSIHGLKRELVTDNDFRRIEPAVHTLARMVVHGLTR
jgi:AcrR family transcriptional regulator